ncbi:LOW QUALITY PROTEIN: E3 ubiquitin-protein ligase rnf213-alpha-like, partial [Phoenicopterus ruber ruber]
MTLEFVAVLSEHCSLDERSKICLVFYKQPGLCEQFANMEKRDRVITGSARIPLSYLQRGLIFYKYALVNTYSPERECELEQISLDNSNIPETLKYGNAQFYRVMNIPKTEIKADGTWTFFEGIECSFPSRIRIWKGLSKKVPRSKIQMEYLEQDFFAHATSWNSLEDTERKLDRYKESIKVSLEDAERGEDFEINYGLDVEAVKDNIGAFIQVIMKHLKTEKHKLRKLLFAFHASVRYRIHLSPEFIAKAEKRLQAIEFSPDEYQELRGKRKVLKMIEAHKTLIGRCAPLAMKVVDMVAMKNFSRDPLPDIWLPLQLLLETLYGRILDVSRASSQIPEDILNVALGTISIRMDSWFKDLCPSGSSKPPLKPMNEHDILQCLNLVYILLKHLLEEMTWVSFSSLMLMLRILGMFVSKVGLLQANKEFQQFTSAERFQEFSRLITLWLERHFHKAPTDEKSFLKNVETWQQLLSEKILCAEWTKEWRGLIHNMFEKWLKKVNDKYLVDFYWAFLKTEKHYSTELESCFMNHVIQWIRALDKSEEFRLKSMITMFLKTSKPAPEMVLSVLVEKMCSEMKKVGSIDTLDESTGLILANPLNTPGICDLISAVYSSFSKCITQVLEVRKQEFEQLEEQKRQRCSFLCLCRSIEDMIKVDRSIVEKSIMDNKSFKDQMSVKKFSIDGKSEMESHVLDDYSDMMQKLHVVEKSQCFRRLWKMRAEQTKATTPEDQVFSVEDVQERIYKPAIADFQKTYLSLKDFSITLGTIQSQFEKLLGEKDQLLEEFKIMEDSEGPRGGEDHWIAGVVERIENYLTLSKVVNTAKMIDGLRQMLQLERDFQILSDLTKYEEQEFKDKRLNFMTQDLMKVKKSLSDIPQGVLNFLRELLAYKTEIPVFVELASISAGENDMDIDRVRFFRDAMAASAPIVLDLSPTAGFEQFSAALSSIREAIGIRVALADVMRDLGKGCALFEWKPGGTSQMTLRVWATGGDPVERFCDNREWIQMVHDSHGSVERSSISQARSINRNGIFTISAPPKFKLTELQNKLMLITTKVAGREDANRFLDIEKVETVGKLYLELLSVGKLFIDWKADIYCNPQQRVKVYTEFGVAGILVQSTRPLLEELDSLSKSMEHCLAEWKKYLETQRDTYYHLNLFTAHQLFYLCSQLARVQKGIVEPQVLIMLSIIKHDIQEEDIKKALGDALMTPLDSVNTAAEGEESITWHNYIIRFPQFIKSLAESGYDESVAKAALQSCLSSSPITEQMLMDFAFEQGDDKELVEELSKFTLAHDELAASFESLPSIYDKVNLLWDAYCKKFTGLVSDKYVGLDVFGETLKRLAALESVCVERSLPVGFEAGKPLLILCKEEEMLPNMLFYRHAETAPLPSYDEVLVCTPDTEEEEVELLVRRALSPGSQDQKIYCLLGADKLVYKVSKQLESHFFHLVQSSSIPNYRFIIFCNTKAHNSYVITAFDAYKGTFPCYSKAEIQTYLKMHLKVPSGTAPVAQAFEEPYQQNVKFVFSEQAGMVLRGGALLVKESATEIQPTIFHIDVSPVVSKGLYRLLIDLCILHIQSPDGLVWKCKPSHLYLIEYLAKGRGVSSTRKREMSVEMEEKFLDLLPTVECVSPLRVLSLLGDPRSVPPVELREEQFDRDKLNSEVFQRSYQYLSRYKWKENLDHYFSPWKDRSEKECLACLMEFCGRSNPSWTELSNFTHFLNFQLRKCEKSVFCSPVVGREFCGFKTFIIKFMIAMSKDFAMPSLNMSDESVPSEEWKEMDDVLREYQLRRKWEQESHPYIVFHAEGDSMEFLGFHINQNFDAIDAYSQAVLEKAVMSRSLYVTLALQNVPFNKKFEALSRTEQLEALCRVFGVKCQEDPDVSYQLTLDNTMKMLAIHLRFQCGIPVIIMGETGCGKTKLVQFMCNLQRAGREVQNMVVVRVHGGTTSKTIQEKVRQAIEMARDNEEKHDIDTVLFFDEANTSEAIFAIKEVLCDHSVNGKQIATDRLKVVAACNPYKRHTKETIGKLEKAGLGYRVRSEDPEKLGYIPLRQLVYRVQPLPRLLPLVWDFGELNEKMQSLYIREIVKSAMETKIPAGNLDVFTNVILASQKFLRERKDECRVASLRDIDRWKIVLWFYDLRDLLFHQLIDGKRQSNEEEEPTLNDAQRALVLSVGACYSLESRQEYLEEIAKCFSVPASQLQQEIELCQEVFLDQLSIPKATACNNTLRENIFMMVVCMVRVPLFLVGKPGSSKSLSKTIAVDAMKGTWSKSSLFKRCKEVQLLSFQCSPHSKPEGIISTFRQCAQFQKGKNLNEFASVVLLDEIGLAEDSPDMPLKTLHPLLEDGCVDDENPEAYKKVGFVGISNWALDPAKMKGLLVFRTEPSEEELVKTAKGICADQPHLERIEHLFPILANFYCNVLKTQKTEFFGLRDFYSLIKMIVSYMQDKKRSSQEEVLVKAIQRNFGGSRDIRPLEIFRSCTKEVRLTNEMETSCIRLLEENMDKRQAGFMSRYLLLLTTNNAAFQIIQMTRLIDTSNCDIIWLRFPRDQDFQVCRSVNRVKICMEIGRPVVLLNIQNLYESLYDTLNQCFVSLGGNYYVDLGLGTHRVKSRVKEEFRLIVIEEKTVVQFPTPLLSRLEKHCLDMNTILNWQQQDLKRDLERWASQSKLVECATPDSILRLKYSALEDAKQIQDLYFIQQKHNSLASLLRETMNQQKQKGSPTRLCLQVSTHARLLNQKDLEVLRKTLGLPDTIHCLFLSHLTPNTLSARTS